MPEGDLTGGSLITSLNLQWDQGTSGAQWSTLIGELPDSTTTTFLLTGVLVEAGKIYKFRYRAKNIFGWGDYSDQGDVLSAAEPEKLDSVILSLIGTDVRVSWVAKADNGVTISAYRVKFKSKDDQYSETSFCDGAATAVFTAGYCLVPMATFTATPFELVEGALIVGTVEAYNSIGWSTASDPNTSGQYVETPPLTAPSALTVDLAQTSES